MDLHMKRLQTLCRICSRKLGKVSYSTTSALMSEFFQGNHTSSDNPAVHPPRFCNSCYLTMRQTMKARKDGSVHRTSLTLHSWIEHQDEGCSTCDMVVARSVGGRPKKKKNIPSCPPGLTQHIQVVAGPRYRYSVPLTTDRFLSHPAGGLGLCTADVTCSCCNNIVDQAVELACKHLLCCTCCLKLLTTNHDCIPCPHCKQKHPQVVASIQAPPPLVVKFLQQLLVRCDRVECTEAVYLKDLQAHLDSRRCKKRTNVGPVLTPMEQPTSAPPTRAEMETAGLVVRKILQSQPQGQVISLPTGGCVSYLVSC